MQDDPDNFDPLIDPVIDDVAREMTGARPAGDHHGLARRVSARIQEAEAARAPRAWSRAWLLAPAAACVALLAVFLLRDTNVRPTTSVETTAVKKPDALPEIATDGVRPAAMPQSASRPSPQPVPDAAPFAREIDLDLQPLTMAPIELASLDVSPLVVAMPIEISTIAIERIEILAMP